MANRIKIRTAHGESIINVPTEGSFQADHFNRLLEQDKVEILADVDDEGVETPRKAAAAKKTPAKPRKPRTTKPKPQGAVVDAGSDTES